MKNRNSQSGQVLLIVVMLLATVLALTFSVSFTSQTETQTTKLEEDSKKALAAAEALLEASMRSAAGTTINASSLPNLSGFTGSATVSETTGTEFVTPILQKDEQYTFYLSTYTAPNFSDYFSGTINLYMKSEDGCPAVELTYVDKDTNAVTRSFVDPCDSINGFGELGFTTTGSGNNTLKGVVFTYITDPILITNKKLMFMRVLSSSTKLGIKSTGPSLPSQGKTTTAQATTGTSVTSTVTLFQSYPQIPAEFFVTSF